MKRALQIGRRVTAFLSGRDGAAASEYAVLLAIIACASIAAIAAIGYHVAGTASSVSAGLPTGSELQVAGPAATTQSHVTSTNP